MSTDSHSTLRPRFLITPTVKIAFLAWALLFIGAFVLYEINSTHTAALRDDMNTTRKSLDDLRSDHESGNPELHVELSEAREESRSLTERINQLESSLGQESIVSPERSLTASELAVQKANAARHQALANAAVRDLGKLKTLQMEWAALEAKLMNGQEGARLAGSAKHLQRVTDVLHQERPTAEQIVEWESRLTPLTEPFTLAAAESTPVAITEEHESLLSDLGKELKTATSEFERQKLLLESIQRETSSLKPSGLTLAAAIEQHREEQELAEAERLAHVRQTAKNEAEKAGAARIAKAEQDLAEAKIQRTEQKIAAEKE